ncbi:MAG: VCBS repeat-containing protein [Phycisphaerales bacterium]|nr:VCBS repeat-containing protein [Phycisphaerales bacterium]
MNKTVLTGIAGLAVGLTAAVGFGAWSGAPVFDDSLVEEWNIDPYVFEIVDTADFDQDGFDDLVAVQQVSGNYRAAVLINQSGKGFTQVFTTNVAGQPDYWNAADVNGDGYPDLVHARSSEPYATVLINQLANEKVCATDLDKSGSTEINDLLFVIEDWGPCQDK